MESQKRVKLEKVDDVVLASGTMALNPMMVDLVLDNVFLYFKNSPASSIKNFRLVCKLWNRKLDKMLKEKTEIDIIRLVSRYPKGLGWTTEGSGENGEPSYSYRCPYPVESNFENLKVMGTCRNLTNFALIRWFEKMGSNVKSFHFKSSLTCFHHTRFLECVMKKWCKNLSRLYLDGFIFSECFLFGGDFHGDPFLMDQLKEIILNSESDEVKSSDCGSDIELQMTYLVNTQSEIKWDGVGVWEKIVGHVGVEKLLIKNVPPLSNACKNLVVSFPPPATFMNENQEKEKGILRLAQTLKDFEYDNFFFKYNSDLICFRKMKFPLTKLCFGALSIHLDGSLVTSLLESLSGTLKHLEFQGTVFNQYGPLNETLNVRIPSLPHLQIFKNRDLINTPTGTLDFVKNLPSLETCSLWTDARGRDMFPPGLQFEHNTFEQNNLKELELHAKIRYATHVAMIGNWFPNLKTLSLMLEGKRAFTKFMDLVETMGLEELKLSSCNGDCKLNNDLIYSLCKMPNLRFLELVYLTDRPFNISLATCENGFAKAPKLTSLKLTNVSMYIHEQSKIRAALSRISCIRLTKCVFQMLRPTSPTNLEFSIGNNVQFPSID